MHGVNSLMKGRGRLVKNLEKTQGVPRSLIYTLIDDLLNILVSSQDNPLSRARYKPLVTLCCTA